MNEYKLLRILTFTIGFMFITLPFELTGYEIQLWQYIFIMIGGMILSVVNIMFPPDNFTL